MSSRGQKPGGYDHDSVMARVALVAGLDADAQIAAELGASPQSFAAWKRRGTVPFERICEFAMRRNISLDWLLLGVGGPGPIGNPIDHGIFSDIFTQLHAALLPITGADGFPWPYFLSGATSIYDKVVAEAEAQHRKLVMHAEICTRAASYAHAIASDLRQKKRGSAREIERLELLARDLETAAEPGRRPRRSL